MIDVIAQSRGSDFDWTSLAYVALLVLGGLSSIITKIFVKKDDTIDAEIDDDTPAAPPQPQRPVARAPQPARRIATPAPPPTTPAPRRPAAPNAQPEHSRPQTPVPRPAPRRTVVVQPQAPPPARRTQPQRALRQPAPRTVIEAEPFVAETHAVPDMIEPLPTEQSAAPLDMNASNLRRAIILSEILAPPVALRSPDDAPGASVA